MQPSREESCSAHDRFSLEGGFSLTLLMSKCSIVYCCRVKWVKITVKLLTEVVGRFSASSQIVGGVPRANPCRALRRSTTSTKSKVTWDLGPGPSPNANANRPNPSNPSRYEIHNTVSELHASLSQRVKILRGMNLASRHKVLFFVCSLYNLSTLRYERLFWGCEFQ